ncbi:carboxypeptidase M32 [uncultured Ruegeria sp.]|uniref:carboxypeptidase M32 n=1 Tax=uncultured Ruegeria sp. TaxID=259304 RepID=UPI002610BB29|nr:carboxypeptidase M32 [uncultured Ruegeria sp.]
MKHDFRAQVARLNDILCSVNLLRWDAKVTMPPGGSGARGHQIATLLELGRQALLNPKLTDAAEDLLHTAESALDRKAAQTVLDAQAYHKRIPADLLRRQTETATIAAQAWAEARREKDFSIYQEHLQQSIEVAREYADAVGYEDHPYDAMVQVFEPSASRKKLDEFFDQLRDGILPILDKAMGGPAPRDDFLSRSYPIDAQKQFCEELVQTLGYGKDRGRLDTSVHPHSVSFTRDDARITTRWDETNPLVSIFGALHEAGHALYEMGVDPSLTRSVHATDLIKLYAAGGASFGMHESQSHLIENHIGRTPEFWDVHFGRLRDTFPEQLRDVTASEFVAAVNRVTPRLIRLEADELTYELHIILRVRIEIGLMDGSLSVVDVPEAWNAAMAEDLGLAMPDDGVGCLQDAHWSSNYIGHFPTYSYGNSVAAQLMDHITQTRPSFVSEVAKGDGAVLRETLGELVWRHGRSLSPAELLAEIGQSEFDPTAYLGYLGNKFAA